jgi:hypothetical protein
MAESKWDKTLSALNYPAKVSGQTSAVLLLVKDPLPLRKRSTPGWKPKQMLLKEDTVALVQAKLKA